MRRILRDDISAPFPSLTTPLQAMGAFPGDAQLLSEREVVSPPPSPGASTSPNSLPTPHVSPPAPWRVYDGAPLMCNLTHLSCHWHTVLNTPTHPAPFPPFNHETFQHESQGDLTQVLDFHYQAIFVTSCTLDSIQIYLVMCRSRDFNSWLKSHHPQIFQSPRTTSEPLETIVCT